MAFAVLGQIINMWIIWDTFNIGTFITYISLNICLNLLFFGFFIYMYRITPDISLNIKLEDIQNIFSSIQKEVFKDGNVQKEAKNGGNL